MPEFDLKVLALPLFALLMLVEAVVTSLRGHPVYEWRDFGGSMSQLAMNIAVKLGVDGAVATIYGFWTHTETVGRLHPALEYIFVTPSHHRAHHGSNPEYIDRNYANFLIIWDRLFGTFAGEKAPVRYGLTRNIGTFNPLRIGFEEWGRLLRDSWRNPGLIAWLWLAPPEVQANAGESGFVGAGEVPVK